MDNTETLTTLGIHKTQDKDKKASDRKLKRGATRVYAKNRNELYIAGNELYIAGNEIFVTYFSLICSIGSIYKFREIDQDIVERLI